MKASVPTSSAGFDRVAPIYDLLAQLVFGNRLNRAKVQFFSHICPGERVLIIGGGTGWILPQILEKIGETGSVLFVEASAKMMSKARHRIRLHPMRNRVRFLHGRHDAIPVDHEFDHIHTHFFLDLFDQEGLQEAIGSLDGFLPLGGKWFLTDFSPPRHSWNFLGRWLIGLMFLFFRVVCGIDGKKLPDYHSALEQAAYGKLAERTIWDGMIGSFLYQKKEMSSKL